MSKKNMENFLLKLKGELRSNSKFRSMDADVAQNTFYFSPRLLINQLEREFMHRNVLDVFNQKSLQTFLKKELGDILKKLQTNAKTNLANRTGVTLKGNQYYMLACLQTEINPKTNKGFSNFSKLKTIYTKEMNEWNTKLIEHLEVNFQTVLKKSKTDKWNQRPEDRKIIEGDQPIKLASDLWEAGHDDGFQILESKVQASINSAFKAYHEVADIETMNENLRTLGVDLRIVRDDKTGTYSFALQSRWDNQQAGHVSAADSRDFKKQLNVALEKLGKKGKIAGLKGSPSLKDIKDNKLLVNTLEPFDKLKDVKTTKPKAIKLKKRAPVKKKGKTKPKKSPMKLAAPLVKKVTLEKAKRRKKTAASQPLQLIGVINKELPNTVRKNMREPALVNRTGRFAESVKLTEVIQTPRGYPSFGYTYQREPYQVFEEGSSGNWSNGKRDPRDLIDKSIREIAAQFAIGRFYTRRV